MIEHSEYPTLNSLIAFESTVRNGSMTKAANELNISQPLVSQRIRSLEDAVGGILIDRNRKPIYATAEGMRFFNQIQESLKTLLNSTENLKRDFKQTKIKVSIAAYFGFAFHWIMPRLQRLQEAFPDYLFEILPTNSQADLFAFESDIVFHYAERVGKYTFEQLILKEEIFPVCSPEFAQNNQLTTGQIIHDLGKINILHKDVDDARWPNWQGWSEKTGVKYSQNPITFRFNNYPLVVEAAIKGQGLCLGWGGLVDAYITEGKLIALGPTLTSNVRGYQLCSNYNESLVVNDIIRWFLKEAG